MPPGSLDTPFFLTNQVLVCKGCRKWCWRWTEDGVTRSDKLGFKLWPLGRLLPLLESQWYWSLNSGTCACRHSITWARPQPFLLYFSGSVLCFCLGPTWALMYGHQCSWYDRDVPPQTSLLDEVGSNFLPGLALNLGPPSLCLLSSLHYRCELPHPVGLNSWMYQMDE
jgi:hypothetical protein